MTQPAKETFLLTLDEARQIVIWAEQGRSEYAFRPNDRADAAIAELRHQLERQIGTRNEGGNDDAA